MLLAVFTLLNAVDVLDVANTWCVAGRFLTYPLHDSQAHGIDFGCILHFTSDPLCDSQCEANNNKHNKKTTPSPEEAVPHVFENHTT